MLFEQNLIYYPPHIVFDPHKGLYRVGYISIVYNGTSINSGFSAISQKLYCNETVVKRMYIILGVFQTLNHFWFGCHKNLILIYDVI